MTPLISKEDAKEIARLFSSRLAGEVEVILFTSERGSAYCATTRQLLEEVASQSEKVKLTVLDLEKQPGRARELAVDLAPELLAEADFLYRKLTGAPIHRW